MWKQVRVGLAVRDKAPVLEWAGCATGLLGALLIAVGNETAWWGFAAFMASNLLWLAFAMQRRVAGLFAMQLAFSVTSVIGLIRYW